MPPAIIAIGAAVGGAFIASSAAVIAAFGVAGAAALGVTASMVIQFAGSALLGSAAPEAAVPSMSQRAAGIMANTAGTAQPIPVVYGTVRLGGARVLMTVTGDIREILHLMVVLGEGEIDSIPYIYMDGVPSDDASWPAGIVTITSHLGADDQAADAAAVAEIPGWTEAHTLSGLAYLYARLEYDRDDPSFHSIPTITATVKGRKLYDPRTGTTAWSANPALCVRDYLTSARYGRGIAEELIDDDSFGAMADHCDELITLAGAACARYTCNGVVDTSQPMLSVMEQLLSCCRGMLVFAGGKYRLVIDRQQPPADFAFTEDNITGAWSIALGDKRTMFNRVRAAFVNPEKSWKADIATADAADLRAGQDNNLMLDKQIDLPFTANAARAAQLATMVLKQSRQSINVKFTAFSAGLKAEVGDVVPITHATPGWQAKLFMIVGLSLRENGEVDVVAREYADDVYDWGQIEAADAAPNTTLPNLRSVSPPTGLSATESLYVTRDGAGVKCMAALSWTAPSDCFVVGYEVRHRYGTGSWVDHGRTRQTAADIYDLAAGAATFQVRAVNTLGLCSRWATVRKTIAALGARPAAITGLSLRVMAGLAHLSWDQSADLDVRIGGRIRVRHAAETTDALWPNAIDVGLAVPGSATSIVLPAQPGTYLLKAVDSSGHAGASAAAVVCGADDIFGLATEDTSTQDPTFSGTKTGMVVVDSALTLEAAEAIDDWSGNVDDVSDWDTEGGLGAIGTYEFAAVMDLTTAAAYRLLAAIELITYSLDDNVDGRSGDIDDWPDWDDSDIEDASVLVYVASTPDDPSGSPDWSDWILLTAADIYGRAFKFKVEVEAADARQQVEISALSVTAKSFT